MGWLEGLLSGYSDRHHAIQAENAAQAEAARAREEGIYKMMLNHESQEMRDLGASGLFSMMQPRKRKSGFAGWMGELESSPMLPGIQRFTQAMQQGEGEPIPGQPSIPAASGALPGASAAPTGALPATSPVTGGAVQPVTPPPAPPGSNGPYAGMTGSAGATPSPYAGMTGSAGGPPSPWAGMVGLGGAAEPPPPGRIAEGLGPTMPGTPVPPPTPPRLPLAPPRPPGLVSPGLPGATTQTLGRQAPPPRRRTNLLPSAEDIKRQSVRAEVGGTIDTYTDMYLAANPGISEVEARQRAAQLFEREKVRTSGVAGQSYAEGNIVPDPSSPTGYSQELYLRADPRVKQTIPAQPPTTPEELAKRATAVGAAKAGIPLTQEQITSHELSLRDDWRMFSANVREQQSAIAQMKAAYQHAKQTGSLSAPAEAIIVLWQKGIDPNSVVRESEANRPGQFSGLTTRAQGMWDRLTKGGAVIPLNELADYIKVAEEMEKAAAYYIEDERDRIENMIVGFKGNPRNVVPPRLANSGPPGALPGAGGTGGGGGGSPTAAPATGAAGAAAAPVTAPPASRRGAVKNPQTGKWEYPD